MAAADSLPAELKEYALTLDRGVFPKNLFCALCDQLAFDAYKLLCCNKAICSPCHAKLEFPTTCPSCDHNPVEAESCTPNKNLRVTLRRWLLTRKKKEEAKAAAEAAIPAVDTMPTSGEVQPPADASDRPIQSVEDAPQNADGVEDQTVADSIAEGASRRASAAPQQETSPTAPDETLKGSQDANEETGQDGDQNLKQAGTTDNDQNVNATNGPMNTNNTMMNGSGMSGQFGFGFNGAQGNFNMGMGPMSNMPNMMNPGWNSMGFGMNNMSGMFGFGGNMGMGMNDMSMNYGNGFSNGWNGMGGGYGVNGYMGGYNGPLTDMNYPKNPVSSQNRFYGNGQANFPQKTSSRNGSFANGQGAGSQHNSRPGSRSGTHNVRRYSSSSLPKHPKASQFLSPPSQKIQTDDRSKQRDGQSPAGGADPALVKDDKDGQASASAGLDQEGKNCSTVAEGEASAEPSNVENAASKNAAEDPAAAGAEADQSVGLNHIQTVDSIEPDDQSNPMMMGNGMQMSFPNQMMNMNGPYNHMGGMGNMGNMGIMGNMGNMGPFHNNNNGFGPRGGFNNAYGAATVLTGEPRGVGVEGAPTGPRAMREGRPNTGFSGRVYNRNHVTQSATPTTEAQPAGRSPPRKARSRSPVRDESLRTKEKSPPRSRAGSQAKAAAQDEKQRRSRSVESEHRKDPARSVTPRLDDDANREDRKETRRHRPSRYDDYDERDERDRYEDRGRDERDSRGSRGDRTRSASADSRYRGRRDKEKDKDRSSRSHRDRSREHRRRYNSRSRSPVEDGHGTFTIEKEPGSRRKDRRDRDKTRDRSRDRDRDRERDRDRKDRKDRDYDRDYDDEKYRSREKDKERRRRRDREAEDDDRHYDDDKYRSSRRSRKDRDREREHEKEPSTRAASPPINAPTGPSADNFSIRGASKPKGLKAMPPPQPPTGPRALIPPKGPAADRDRTNTKHSRKGSLGSSVPSTPTEPTVQDHYAAEREKNARARDMLERGVPDRSLHSRISSSHHTSSSRSTLSSKRSRNDYDEDELESRSIPSGPSGIRSKRKKSEDAGGLDLHNRLNKGLRRIENSTRRGGVRTEDDVERELERVERERDGKRR